MSISILKRVGIGAAIVAVGVVGFGVSALASPNTSANSASPSRAQAAPKFQVAGRTSEMTYVPVAPCKLVDTRAAGGPFHANVTRSYHARGNGSLAGQGGSSTGCTLPSNAAVISSIITAIAPNGPGFIQANASDQPSSGVTVLAYNKNQNTTGAANINLSAPGSASAFKIRNFVGTTQISVSVVGYYIAPMGAEVNSLGNLVIGSRVTLARVIPGFPGQYEVIFDRDVTKCYYNATAFSQNLSGEVEPRSGNPNGVFVVFSNNANTITATQFYLTVTC